MDTDTFGEWIKGRRKQLDITQEMLAQRVGCSLSAIRKIENDERRPSRQVAELLALHLEVPHHERTLFLKVARGEGSVHRLGSASSSTEKRVAEPGSFFPPSNIPSPPSPFVGRQQEIESLIQMLTDPRQRLITILGPGGIGKTRLALEVAGRQLTAFDGQVYFIQLAGYNAADAILPAVASTLNIPSSSSEELRTRLSDYLRDKSILLLFDNFEHLIDGAIQLSELLQKTPKLKILVTSRERLNLQGEWTFELGGLTVPPQGDEGRALYSALQLFELHARRIRPDTRLEGVERESAIHICQRVDGMPLAIELAAAWVNLLSCKEIADEIERGFDFLSSTLRDIPEKHRSLRAVFEHSWKRLTESEQTALSQLTIFQGGFSVEAAETVVGAERNVLSSLVSKSLLRRSTNGRFDLHEVIRQYAHDYLKDESALHDRHCEYYLGLLHESEVELFGANQSNLLTRLFYEFGNLHIAWEYALAREQFTLIDSTLESLWMLCDVHGWLSEGIKQTNDLINALRTKPGSQIHLGRALTFHGMLVFRTGEYVRARTTFEEGIRILRETGELKFLPPALIFCGIVISLMGEFAHARVLVNEGVELAGGFLRNGDENEAAALIFLATENSACTDVAKQRGEQLKAKIHQSVEIRTSTKETMETLLARMID